MTVDLVSRIKREVGLEAMAHLTCVGHTASEIASILGQLKEGGVENVLALRGDPPKGQTEFVQTEGGFGYAQDLARFIRANFDFCLGGACYPENHPESPDSETDLQHLKEKADSGVDFLVSQLFFDAASYFAFVGKARALGVTQPIVPGIMPVTNVSQLERFTTLCGASIPTALRDRLEQVRDNDQAVIATGIDWATDQCRTLLAGGAPGIHFYTLNRSHSTREVFRRLTAG
jgi:methylenetetrahydrofolate reductase (NADPH)